VTVRKEISREQENRRRQRDTDLEYPLNECAERSGRCLGERAGVPSSYIACENEFQEKAVIPTGPVKESMFIDRGPT
jgi:hypothetical protein